MSESIDSQPERKHLKLVVNNSERYSRLPEARLSDGLYQASYTSRDIEFCLLSISDELTPNKIHQFDGQPETYLLSRVFETLHVVETPDHQTYIDQLRSEAETTLESAAEQGATMDLVDQIMTALESHGDSHVCRLFEELRNGVRPDSELGTILVKAYRIYGAMLLIEDPRRDDLDLD